MSSFLTKQRHAVGNVKEGNVHPVVFVQLVVKLADRLSTRVVATAIGKHMAAPERVVNDDQPIGPDELKQL